MILPGSGTHYGVMVLDFCIRLGSYSTSSLPADNYYFVLAGRNVGTLTATSIEILGYMLILQSSETSAVQGQNHGPHCCAMTSAKIDSWPESIVTGHR